MLERMYNYLGVVPAEWFQQLNDPQKIVFLTLTGTVAIFAVIILLLLRSRGRVTGMDDKIPKELWSDIEDAIHDVIFDKWLVPEKITPKGYKLVCYILEPKLPGLRGKLYTEAARKIMKVRSHKYNAAQNVLSMQKVRESGVVSGYQAFVRRMALSILKGDQPTNKFTASKKIS